MGRVKMSGQRCTRCATVVALGHVERDGAEGRPQLLTEIAVMPPDPDSDSDYTPGMPSSAATAPCTWDDFVALDKDDLREPLPPRC
jgi:hypothetical protein